MALSISITEKAASKVKHFASQENQGDPGIRVAVKGGGCSGLMYDLSIINDPREDDKIIEEHGVKIFVDKKSYVFLAGTVLDFSDGLNGKGFTFLNPQAKSTCGCGVSFSA